MLLTIASRTETIAQFITVLVLFIIVLVLTAFTTKWIAGYQKKQGINSNIEVIESQRISTNKYIQILRSGDKYLVIAICKDTVTLLCELTKDEIEFRKPIETEGIGFRELLEKAKKRNSTSDDEQGPKEK